MAATTRPRPRREAAILIAIAALQIVCSYVFVEDLVVSVLGLRTEPVNWTWRETIEIMAAAGLILGTTLGFFLIRALRRERRRAEETLRAASGDFQALVSDRFEEWRLTPSERDVALFMLKGFANQEIAALRGSSEGTIKAQATAVFRKAGVGGRPQLLSSFIEDLLAEEAAGEIAGRASRKGS